MKTTLEKIRNIASSYIDDRIHGIPGIRLRYGGAERMMQVCGWITGIADAGKIEEAEHLANSFWERLEWVGTHQVLEGNIPDKLCYLGDDGSFGNFTIGWYRYDNTCPYEVSPAECNVVDSLVHHYKPMMHGGLILHGYRHGNLMNMDWSSHT